MPLNIIGLVLLLASSVATAQTYLPVNAEINNIIEKHQLDTEANITQVQNEIKKLKNYTDNLHQPSESLLDMIRRTSEERQAAQMLNDQQDAERQRASEELTLTQAHTGDFIDLSLVGFFILAFIVALMRGGAMKKTISYHEKYGILIMTCSLLLSAIAILLSDDWYPRMDFVQNIMLSLHVRFLSDSDSQYIIDFPTKYLLISFSILFSYGFTAYFAISPVWMRFSSERIQQSSTIDTDSI